MKKILLSTFVLVQIVTLCASERGFINGFAPVANSSQNQKRVSTFSPPVSPVKCGKKAPFSPYAAMSYVAPSPTSVTQIKSPDRSLATTLKKSNSSVSHGSSSQNVFSHSSVMIMPYELDVLINLAYKHEESIIRRRGNHKVPRSFADFEG